MPTASTVGHAAGPPQAFGVSLVFFPLVLLDPSTSLRMTAGGSSRWSGHVCLFSSAVGRLFGLHRPLRGMLLSQEIHAKGLHIFVALALRK